MYVLRLFSGISLDGLGDAEEAGLQHRSLAVLALLAVARDKGCSRDKLIGYLWAESDQERARHRLSDTVYMLRKSLGDEAVELSAGGVLCLNPDVVESDAGAFLDALDAGELETAAELYEGPFLDGFYTSGAAEFERWAESERQRFAAAYANALERLGEQAEAASDYRRAVELRKRLLAQDPYNSRYVLGLMEALARSGDPANAIQVAQEHGRLLKEELDAEPLPEVLDLAERLRREAGEFVEVVERPRMTAVDSEPAAEHQARPRRGRLLLALTIYLAFSLAIVVTAHVSTLLFGFPSWLFSASVALLFACLPFVILTALLESGPGTKDWLSWRVTVVLISTAFGVLWLAVSGYVVTRALGIGPWATLMAKGVLQERDLIVLAGFEDHANDLSLAQALTELVRVDLAQSAAVRVADEDHVGRVLERMEKEPDAELTRDLAREVAIREGLKAVVTGEIHRVGSGYVLSLGLVAAETGKALTSFRETASDLDGTIPATEQMSRKLRERVGESLKTVRGGPPLGQARTASLEALRLYTEADRAKSRGEYQLAIDRLDKAIEIDTLFAAAYRSRASAFHALQIRRAQRIADATRAYELRHRLPRWERYWVEAGYHVNVTGDEEKVVSAFRVLLELEPENTEALDNLGEAYHRLRDYVRAEEIGRRLLELDSPTGWSLLARALFHQGRFDEAWETLRQWEAKWRRPVPIHRAYFASAQGDYAAAEAYLRDYRDLRRESLVRQAAFNLHMGQLAQVQGKLASAEDYWRSSMALYTEAGEPRRYYEAAAQLAGLRLWFRGDTTRARETMAEALERYPLDSLGPPDRPYPLFPGFYAFAGAPERARELLAEWDTVLPPDRFGHWWDVYRHAAQGAVALTEGRAEEALLEFRWVEERWFCAICALPLLGRTYELAGQPDSALAMYERYLTTPWWRRTLTGDSPDHGNEPYWLPVVYERLGDLYEQRGDRVNAIHYYGKLVDLWKNADPELQPRVEAARRAIKALSPDT